MTTSRLLTLAFLTAWLLCLSHALPNLQPIPRSNAQIHPIYEFPNETWVENLAVRSNGNILVTILTAPQVWSIDPTSHAAELVYEFPEATAALGISELEHDVFAVAVGNLSSTSFKGTKGSWGVWTIDLTCLDEDAKVRNAVAIDEALFLNGMTTLSSEPGTVLVADSALGVVFSANTTSGKYTTALDEPAFKPNTSAPFALGINGIHVREEWLYFINSFASPLLGRVPINANGTAAGPVETVVAGATFHNNLGGLADDFTFDDSGNAFVTTDPSNTLIKVSPAGSVTVVAGGFNQSVIAGDTAAAFGRTVEDRHTLYITTNGGLADPPPGGLVGGKLVAIEGVGSESQ